MDTHGKMNYTQQLEVEHRVIKHAPKEIGFKVLGTQMTFDGCETREIIARIEKAWKSFWVHRKVLTCKKGKPSETLKTPGQVHNWHYLIWT